MNNIKLKINLIPLFILMGIGVLIYFVFLNDKELFDFNKDPEVRRLNGFPTTIITDKEYEKKRLVLTTPEQLAEFLNEVDSSGYLIVRDDIDFEKEMLLAISSSTNEEEGHEIKVKKVYDDKENNKLLVSVREIEPGKTCEIIPNKNINVDLVAISKTDKEIEFERVKEVKECD